MNIFFFRYGVKTRFAYIVSIVLLNSQKSKKYVLNSFLNTSGLIPFFDILRTNRFGADFGLLSEYIT